jgi:hypothetical protein
MFVNQFHDRGVLRAIPNRQFTGAQTAGLLITSVSSVECTRAARWRFLSEGDASSLRALQERF